MRYDNEIGIFYFSGTLALVTEIKKLKKEEKGCFNCIYHNNSDWKFKCHGCKVLKHSNWRINHLTTPQGCLREMRRDEES